MTSEQRWIPNGWTTWTTDFGLGGAFVGTMKGVFGTRFPEGRWIDLSHGIPAQDTGAAALELRHAFAFFPVGTLHVAIVDPGVGTSRRILVAERDGHAFLAPDNGLLGGLLGPQDRVWVVDSGPWELPNRSATFHGRDVFAPLAAALASGRCTPADCEPCDDWERGVRIQPEALSGGCFQLRILMVDRFGNLVTNWDVSQSGTLPKGAEVRIGTQVVPIVGTYADVPSMGILGLIDSLGHLEVAQRNGSAADRLGLGVGDAIELRIKP